MTRTSRVYDIKARDMISSIIYFTLRFLLRLLLPFVCRCTVEGREQVPASGPLLIVSNHLSWFDPLLLGIMLPRRAWFFAKKEILHWLVVGWLLRLTGQIAVRRGESDRAALEQALAYLKVGRALVVFPEGTVERQEQMLAGRTGAAMLALRSGATVLPIAHNGTRRVLRPGGGLHPYVHIAIGKPYIPTVPPNLSRKESLQLITTEMMQRIADLLPAQQRGAYGTSS
ncbi:MAG: 1-acyl-sn-glycerol-3-phosphate acyltransferase [Ktedonobacteraceae bacterium]|nr:1-acyl-sn-glycerol-3-phosphate acyltransferase [Ktedonobacteraceae bacterium]